MHDDPSIVAWPDYQEFRRWLETEVDGLSDVQLDFDSQDPAREWMWWSIRRQVSHVAWVFWRSCGVGATPFCGPTATCRRRFAGKTTPSPT